MNTKTPFLFRKEMSNTNAIRVSVSLRRTQVTCHHVWIVNTAMFRTRNTQNLKGGNEHDSCVCVYKAHKGHLCVLGTCHTCLHNIGWLPDLAAVLLSFSPSSNLERRGCSLLCFFFNDSKTTCLHTHLPHTLGKVLSLGQLLFHSSSSCLMAEHSCKQERLVWSCRWQKLLVVSSSWERWDHPQAGVSNILGVVRFIIYPLLSLRGS